MRRHLADKLASLAYPNHLPVGFGWMEQARCRTVDDLERMFSTRQEDQVKARSVCRGCPVLRDCLSYALVTASLGVAGGMTQWDRRRMVNRALRGRCQDCGASLPPRQAGKRPFRFCSTCTSSHRSSAGWVGKRATALLFQLLLLSRAARWRVLRLVP